MVSEPEKQETVQTVEKDRKQQIDALIPNIAGSGTDAAHKELDPEKLVTVQNFEVGRKPQIDALILNNKTDYHTADWLRQLAKGHKRWKSASILSLRKKMAPSTCMVI